MEQGRVLPHLGAWARGSVGLGQEEGRASVMEAGSAQEGLGLGTPTQHKGFPSRSRSWQDREGTLPPVPPRWQGGCGAEGQGPPLNPQLGPKPVHGPPFSP